MTWRLTARSRLTLVYTRLSHMGLSNVRDGRVII